VHGIYIASTQQRKDSRPQIPERSPPQSPIPSVSLGMANDWKDKHAFFKALLANGCVVVNNDIDSHTLVIFSFTTAPCPMRESHEKGQAIMPFSRLKKHKNIANQYVTNKTEIKKLQN